MGAEDVAGAVPGHDPDPRLDRLARDWGLGKTVALGELAPLVVPRLRRTARALLRGEHASSLHSTELVNEAFLRLMRLRFLRWRDAGHVFAMCHRLMRRVLVEHARARRAAKRGAGRASVAVQEGAACVDPTDFALSEALGRLRRLDPRKAGVVELRFMAGYGVVETARMLGVSPETVARDWRFARAWLRRELVGARP